METIKLTTKDFTKQNVESEVLEVKTLVFARKMEGKTQRLCPSQTLETLA